MLRDVRGFLTSVGGRLLLPLALTAAAVFAVHAMLGFRVAQEHFLDFVRADVTRHSDLFERATRDGMMLNRLDEVQATLERLGEGPQIAAIRFYDKQGQVVLSADRSEIGRRITLNSETCESCHDQAEPRDAAMLERSALAKLPDGPDVLRRLTVIENQPQCASAPCHYHPADERVLAILDVELSMAPFDDAVATARKQLVWATLVLVLITGLVAALVIRSVVLRPVQKLREGTRRIARGDLDTRIDVGGGHELAQLADAFNGMVEDLRTAQAEVTEWSQKLEEKVSEKTEALQRAQHQVLHMEKMTSLGKLSASVAHELNNPLSGMLTYARLIRRELADQPLEPQARKDLDQYAGVIDKECKRCGEIVTNLVAFARRGGARMDRVDLGKVIEHSLLLVRHHLRISGVHLETELPWQDRVIVADADQLEQALVALLVNAVEAMESSSEGERNLTVRLRVDADEASIEVRDTGPGIPADVLPDIFEPFFTTKQESGSGLGLSVVFGIAHRHGGTVEVETDPGRGTTFRLRVPREPAATPDETTGENPAALQEQAL
ncbi:MAG: HAMP domain-containing protein [Planctomycetes bacterium]|nr:HAMP domain-containing protein [Planctomycetota bacterium]